MNALATTPSSNAEVYRASTDAANLCKDIVVATAKKIGDRNFVPVEGWMAIAIAHGCAGSARDVERVEGGVRAIGEIRRMADGALISQAEGFVGEDEAVWFGGTVRAWKWGEKRGEKVWYDKTHEKRADYAIRAMAQTRAISRACRSAFAHVVVMMNAGLSTTPAEEVPLEGFDEEPRNVTPPRTAAAEPAAKPPETKLADWRALDDEMDCCHSVEELESWNIRRERDIRALPKARFDALAAKFGHLRETLPDTAPKAPAGEFVADDVPEFA